MAPQSPALFLGPVELPGPLVDAAADGKLVVFAGAGISRTLPAGYPDFEGLTDHLAKHTFVARRKGEAPDAYLGRMKGAPRQIGERAREYFIRRPKATTPVHEALVRLFPSGAATRIITTNYDELFEEAAPELQVWAAPALPRGNEFGGIVHIHGRAAEPSSRIVITDRDFGEAYLSEGWARDFILSLYQAHPVLFVGYSYRDVVIAYLTRGIGVGPHPKYALVADDAEGTDWEALGVTPVVYPNPEGSNHAALAETLAAWADYSRMTEVEHEKAIQAIVTRAKDDVTEESEKSVVRRALAHPSRIRYVTRHAQGMGWVRWMKDEGLLGALVGRDTERVGDVGTLAAWVVEQADPASSPALRAVLTELGGTPVQDLIWRIAYSLLRNPQLSSEELRTWGASLLREPIEPRVLEPILERSRELDVPELTVVALDEVLRPRLQLRPDYFSFMSEAVGVEGGQVDLGDEVVLQTLVDAGIEWEANEACRWLVGKGDAVLDGRLVQVATHHLARGHDLLRATGRTWEHGEDPWSYGQKTFSRLGADAPDDGRDLLVRLALSTYDAIRQRSPVEAGALLDSWATSGYPILIRMAFRATVDLGDSDRVLGFVSDYPELFRWASCDEARQALVDHFGNAAEASRTRAADMLKTETEKGFLFARAAAEALGIDVPPEEEPDVDGGAVVRPRRRSTEGGVFEGDPCGLIEEIEALLAEEGNRPQRGTPRKLADTAVGKPEWGLALADCLAERGAWDSALWRPLFWGARNAMSGDTWPQELAGKVADWPAMAAANERAGLAEALLRRANPLDEGRFRVSEKVLQRAIEEGAEADLVIPALHELARASQTLELEFRKDLLGGIREALEADGSARRAIGVHLHELWAVDKEWTEANVLPYFDAGAHPSLAADLWAGVLEKDVDRLPPPLVLRLIKHLPAQLGRLRMGVVTAPEGVVSNCARMGEELANPEARAVTLAVEAVIRSEADPFDAWLGQFVIEAREAMRVWWTQRVGGQFRLDYVDPGAAWATWGRAYVKRRLQGLPRPFTACEVSQLLDWVASLPATDFDGGVELLEQAPPMAAPNDEFVRRLTDSNLHVTNADAVARMMALALRAGMTETFWSKNTRAVAREVVSRRPPSWPALADALLLSGIATAAEIEAWSAPPSNPTP